jgi:NAD-dependent DNA ligase
MPLEIQMFKDDVKNEVFCFTGESSKGFTREQLAAMVEKNGGFCSSNVTLKTTYLVGLTKPGYSKIEKARRYKTKRLTETQFWAKIGEPGEEPLARW